MGCSILSILFNLDLSLLEVLFTRAGQGCMGGFDHASEQAVCSQPVIEGPRYV